MAVVRWVPIHQRCPPHRVAEVRVETIGQLGDARRDFVKMHGLLAAVPLHYEHLATAADGSRGGSTGERYQALLAMSSMWLHKMDVE